MKKNIKLRPLEELDGIFQMREVEVHVRPRAGIAPGSGVDARWPHERTEMKLA
jgi:hypothetical protein